MNFGDEVDTWDAESLRDKSFCFKAIALAELSKHQG